MADQVPSRVALVAPFGLQPKATVSARALPLALALRELGVDGRLIVPPWDDPERAGVVTAIDGVPVCHTSLAGGPPATAARLARTVSAFRPDVVHVIKPIGYSATTAEFLRWQRRLSGRGPAVVVDGDDWEGRGGWADLNPHPGWRRRLLAWQERRCYRTAGAVIAASEDLRTLVWGMGVSPERVVAVPNGLSAPLAAPEPYVLHRIRQEHRLTDSTVLLYTRFAEYPPEWPAAMLASLRRLRPDAVLLVVGKGFRGEEHRFIEAAASQGVAEAVRYAGWVAPEDLPGYLGAAQVAVVPFTDSLVARTKSSVKLVELMSLGLPVIASAVGENVRYLDFGRAGVLVSPPLDAERWANQVNQALSSPRRLADLGRIAAERVRTHYLWGGLVKDVLGAYEIAGGGRRQDMQE